MLSLSGLSRGVKLSNRANFMKTLMRASKPPKSTQGLSQAEVQPSLIRQVSRLNSGLIRNTDVLN